MAIYLFCSSLKELGSQTAPTDLRGDFRTALADICSDPLFRNENPQPLSYQPGKERELLVFLNRFYKQLVGTQDKEDHEAALQRKINLDRCINDGRKFVSAGKFSEADDCFAEAFKFYRNEFAAYSMMARSMMNAGQYVRALGYIRKGLQERPTDEALRKLGIECARLRNS